MPIANEAAGRTGLVVWFTGLSGSGKSTLAQAVSALLRDRGYGTCVLDGDRVRQGLCADLGFSSADRTENIRRIGEVAVLMAEAGLIVLVAVISPFQADRQRVRQRVAPGRFIEIYCDCPIEVCEQRDVKGLYRRARAGEIEAFTGISSPYEPPLDPELSLPTGQIEAEACAHMVLRRVEFKI